MTTPPEKPFDRHGPSAYTPKRQRERPAAEERAIENDDGADPMRYLSQPSDPAAPEFSRRIDPRTFRQRKAAPEHEFMEQSALPRTRVRRGHRLGLLRILVASGLAVPIAYYFLADKLPISIGGPSGERVTSSAPMAPSAASAARASGYAAAPNGQSAITPAHDDALIPRPATSARAPVVITMRAPAAPLPTAPSLPSATPATAQPAAVEIAAPAQSAAVAPARPTHTLQPDEIAVLLEQGENFVTAGDLAGARLVFQRAAEAGDATAALALGATYDPIMLARLGALGIAADVHKARSWYEKARAYGSPDAAYRLEQLANR